MITRSSSICRTHRRSPRSGAVLIAVLACMMITIVLVGGAMKSTMAARRQCKSELQMQQAELLLQAGVDRVADITQSNGDATTPPELWNAQSAMPEYQTATVEYKIVEPSEDNVRGLKCTVRLGLSSQTKDLIQLSRVIPFKNKQASEQSQTNPESR